MQRTTHAVNLCCMRKSRGIGYGLCNKQYIQHDAYIVVVLEFVARNCPVHIGAKNEKGICILLKLSQFPSLESVCVVSLQTVLCKLHTYICNIQPTD